MSKLVYVGKCGLSDGKPGAILREIHANGNFGDDLIFDRKSLAGANVGSVYEVEPGEKADTWKLAGKRFLYRYSDTTMVAQWQLEASVQQLKEDTKKAERAAARELPAALTLMEPLRAVYRNQLPNGRRAIEILLLEYLRRGM